MLTLLLRRCCNFYIPIFFMAGFLWAAYNSHAILSWTLPHTLEGKPLVLTGTIASLVTTDNSAQHFNFSTTIKQPVLLRLSWPNHHARLLPGDVWQITVKLKRIHGMENPGGFDVEKWALQEHLRATGYVIDDPKNDYISHSLFNYPFAQIRQLVKERIESTLADSSMLPWVLALAVGDRSEVNSTDWEVLRKTGTNHLMAIAGLHIGLLAAAMAWLLACGWRQSPRLLFLLPVMEAEMCAALVSGFIYAMLAGFSLPSCRACLMLCVFAAASLGRRKVNVWIIWSLALLSVLVLDPLAVLSDSFWLSFGTIALVIYGMRGRLQPQGIWWKWCRIQWVIGIGLIPFTLYFFQECSLISLAANSVAIPWLAFFILPVVMAGVVCLFICPPLGQLLMTLSTVTLQLLWGGLNWFAATPFSSVSIIIPDSSYLLLSVIAVFLLLLPAGQCGRWLGLVWCLPVLLYMPPRPAAGDAWLTVLDVGQGLAAVVKTKSHTLIYDAGPKLSEKMDSGENVVVPYLQLDRRPLDALVISHGDNDHIGGAPAIIKAFKIQHIYTSVPDKLPTSVTEYCLVGKSWSWDGVEFAFLYPTQEMLDKVNDSSCVLQVKIGKQTILLPGDIEKAAELALLARVPEQLQASVMLAPHHGSKTSGLQGFIAAVDPQYIIYATGYRNKYKFPHPDVVDSYAAINANQLNTTESGAMTFKLEAVRPLMPPERFRVSHPHYWEDKLV